MHNCKSTRKSLTELALDEMSPPESAQLLADFKDCRACQDEFATIKSTLRTSGQALQSALPAEDFWPGYHARLRTSLATGFARQNEAYSPDSPFPPRSRAGLALRSLLTASIRVPVPVAAALVLLVGISVLFALHSRGAATTKSPMAASTESAPALTRVVEVPVIKEKVVTRVVYVETSGRRPRNAANYLNDGRNDAPVIDVTNGVARVRSDPRIAAMSLTGFKPPDEVKLTIIKGSDPK